MGQLIRHNQSSFSAGEVSDRLYGRVDLKYYQNGLYQCLNMIPFAQGSLTRRVGTSYVATAKSGTDNTLLVPFEFNTVQSYVLEFGNLYMRVYRNRGQVISGGVPYELVTPWLQADVPLLKYVQSADVLYVFHGSYPPQQITRTADNAWTIAQVNFVDGPYLNLNATATTLTASGGSGSITVTASSTTGINGGSGFLATDVNRNIRINNGSVYGYATITSIVSTTVVNANVGQTVPTSAVKTWQLGAWSGTTGYPSVCTLFGERLYAANTMTAPDNFWGSEVGSFTVFSPTQPDGTVTDNNGFSFELNSQEVNAIYSLTPSRVLYINTSGNEWIASGGTFGSTAPITPTNIVVLKQTGYGSRQITTSHVLNNLILFSTRTGRRLFKAEYFFAADFYKAENLNEYSTYITGLDGINYFDIKLEPDTQIWAVKQDGGLISFTYDSDEGVKAWAEHQLGGTNVLAKSLAIIPSTDQTIDDVWLLVQRTVNGSTVQFVEYIGNDYLPTHVIPDEAFFVDAGLQYNGYYASSVTLSATTGSITITAANSVFASTDVGKQFHDGVGGIATITAYSSGTLVSATVVTAPSGTSYAQGAWSLAATSFSGATHLEGQVCDVLGDGAVLPQVTISNTGTFTLGGFYSIVSVGLHYQTRVVTLPVEEQLPQTQQGLIRRISRILLRLVNTVGLTAYADGQNQLQPVTPDVFRTGQMSVGVAIPLFTGITPLAVPAGYDKDGRLAIEQNDPLPMTISSITQEIQLGG